MIKVVSKIKELFLELLRTNDLASMVISKDGYYFFDENGNVKYYYSSIRDLIQEHNYIIDNKLSFFERMFIDTIISSIEEVKQQLFNENNNALLSLMRNGDALITFSGAWSDGERINFEEFIVKQLR